MVVGDTCSAADVDGNGGWVVLEEGIEELVCGLLRRRGAVAGSDELLRWAHHCAAEDPKHLWWRSRTTQNRETPSTDAHQAL